MTVPTCKTALSVSICNVLSAGYNTWQCTTLMVCSSAALIWNSKELFSYISLQKMDFFNLANSKLKVLPSPLLSPWLVLMADVAQPGLNPTVPYWHMLLVVTSLVHDLK